MEGWKGGDPLIPPKLRPLEKLSLPNPLHELVFRDEVILPAILLPGSG